MNETAAPFDRAALRRQRDRAAPRLSAHDFLFREVGERLLDRLEEIRRAFPVALDLGGRDGLLGRLLDGRGGVETVLTVEASPAMARRAAAPAIVAEEEALPIAASSVDLVLSNLALHWVNDLPGALIQARQALRPDGLFLAAIAGGDTLHELRVSLMEAEIEVAGGVSPRLSPLTDVRDAGGLMQRAGFALPMVDSDMLTVSFDSPFRLMADLRGMGETNALRERPRGLTRRAVLSRAAKIYAERFADPDEPGRVLATFQILFLTGWAPAETQPKPLRPGSATGRLADVLATKEIGTGIKPGES